MDKVFATITDNMVKGTDILTYVGKVMLFVLLSLIFVPSFLVVTHLQKTWADMLSKLFGQ